MNIKRLLHIKQLRDSYVKDGQTYRIFRISDDDTEPVEDLSNPELVNDVFNECLQQQIDGTLPKGFVYELGMPSEALKSSGMKDLPIEMAASRLVNKSMQENHPFKLTEVFDLPDAIKNPLAVFRSATVIGAFVILTKLVHNGRNFVAAIHVNKNKRNVEVNDIRSIHYRTLINIVGWISEGLCEYISPDFEKKWFNPTKKELLSKQQYNSVEVREQLNNATKIIEEFNKTN